MSELYIDEWNEEEIDAEGGNWFNHEHCGLGHFLIDNVEDDEDSRVQDESGKWTTAPIKLTIRGVAPEAFCGKTEDLNLYRTGAGSRRTARFARILGLITQEKVNAARAAGETAVKIDWNEAEGMTFCAEREEDEYTAKKGRNAGSVVKTSRINWKVYTVEEGRELNCPIDDDSLDPFANPTPPEKEKAPETNVGF